MTRTCRARRRVTGLWGLGCLALAVTAAPAAAAKSYTMPGCERIVASPDFGRDGTAFCAGANERERTYEVYRTTDHAHSWQKIEPVGLPAFQGWVSDVLISPLFPTDRLLVLTFADEVYYSTDAGLTFRVAPLLRPPVELVRASLPAPDPGPVPLPPVGPQLDHAALLGVGHHPEPGASGSMLFDPVTLALRPVPGTPASDRLFAPVPGPPTSEPALAVGATGNTPFATVERVYACDAAFSCRTPRFAFPAAETVDLLTFAADYERSRVVFATTFDRYTNHIHTYRSADGGRSFARIAVLERAVAEVNQRDSQPAVAFTPTATPSRTVYVRVSAGIMAVSPASERLFRSDDGGAHWRLVAFGRHPWAPGAPGSMPYAYAYAGSEGRPTPRGLLLNTDGSRLLMAGAWWDHGRTVWCSLNGGRSWSAQCPPAPGAVPRSVYSAAPFSA